MSSALPAQAQDTARGVVYLDANRNRQRDAGEAGIAGVSVSNGRTVVQTGADGRYALPVREGDALFVTKPAGYMVPVDENNLPQFYYLHARYEGTSEAMPAPEPSSHLWTAPLPASMAAGTHAVTVTATNEFGQRYARTMALEVAPAVGPRAMQH